MMKLGLALCPSLFVPLAGCSLAAALLAYFTLGEMATPAFVVGTGCVSAICAGLVLRHHERAASAQLRRPELRGRTPTTWTAGVYRNVLTDALELLEWAEALERTATHARTEIEARGHVQHKHAIRLEAALNALDDPVFAADSGGLLRYCNPPAQRLLQQTAVPTSTGDSSSKYDLDAVPPLKQLLEETRTRSAATDRRCAEFVVTVGGESHMHRATATNVYDQSETFQGVVAVLTDIAEVQLAKTRHAEFVSSVSHELKTPMASIKAFVEMLIDGDLDDADEQQEVFGFIDAQVDRLTRMVNSILNLARIESGVIEIKRADCELNAVLRKALSVIEPVAEEKQIRVIPELSELYLAVHIDPDLFSQAIINLLSNAVKYTPQGGEIRLRSRLAEGEAAIEVRDTGMGIPAESLPHVFDRFYRVPQNNKAASGTGLGLSLVHYIVAGVHSGKITVASQVDEGTTFALTVPLGHRDQKRKKPAPALAAV